MGKIFMVRHQKAGIVASHAFASPPSDEQIAPIVAECVRLHGKDGWVKIHEADLLDGQELPSFPDRSVGPAEMQPMTIEGTGTVTPPSA